MSESTPPIPVEAWALLSRLLSRLNNGDLKPEEIPDPTVTRDWSDTLTTLERQLFSPEGRPGEPRARLDAEHAAIRLARFVSGDEPEQLSRFLQVIRASSPDAAWRIQALIECALDPTAPLAGGVH